MDIIYTAPIQKKTMLSVLQRPYSNRKWKCYEKSYTIIVKDFRE